MNTILLALLLVAAIAMILTDTNLTAVILLSVFSMLCAFSYYLYQAPDVAIAELAIGAAILPLLYVISISRQKKFIVLDHSGDSFLAPGHRGHRILSDFCQHFGLELEVKTGQLRSRRILLNPRDIDLIVTRKEDYYLLAGSTSSYLFNMLEELTLEDDDIRILGEEEAETLD